jgi:hypothetical protein
MNASSSSIGTVLLVAGVIFIAFTSMVLAQSEMDGAWWDYSYEGDPMPDGADPVWRCSSDEVSVASISDGILTIDTSTAPGGKLYYYMTLGSSGGKWDGSASSTIEFRARAVKVGPGGNDKAGLLNINTGTQSWTLSLALDKISMPDGAYPLDATEFHVYRITIDNSSGTPLYKVFVDGDLIYTSSEAKSSTTNRIIFGDSDSGAAGANGVTQWDYIRWTNEGAFEPFKATTSKDVDGAITDAGDEVKLGPNLVKNGGFEDGSSLWTSVTVVEDPVYEGKYSGCLDNSDGKPSANISQYNIPVKPYTDYNFSMRVKRNNGRGHLYAYVHWYEEPGKQVRISETWILPRTVLVSSQPGQNVGDWQVLTGTLRGVNPDINYVRLIIRIENGDDVVYIDDVKLQEVQYPQAPPWQFPDAVLFPGAPSKYHMSVENVTVQGNIFDVVTTGAHYRLDTAAGTLTCGQRIGVEREVAHIRFSEPLGPMEIALQNDDVCVVQGNEVAFGFQGDSLITIATNKPLEYTVASKIGTEWFTRSDPHILAIDNSGGFCVMPYARSGFSSPGSSLNMGEVDTKKPGWTADYKIGMREMVAISVFPGKPFDWETSYKKRILMVHAYPEPKALRDFSKYTNVLVIFGYHLYEGHEYAPYKVKDPVKLRETIKLAHELGMEVLLYRQPGSYGRANIGLNEMLDDMEEARREYGFDGWYFDGYAVTNNWYDTYWVMRSIREEVGSGLIYNHCTINPPQTLTTLYSPFIDSYSDFLLRGEGQLIEGGDDPYLRYIVGTYNISNSIATLKGDKMIKAPGSNMPASIRQQLEAMLKINGRFRWAYPKWPIGYSEMRDYVKFYYGELDKGYKEWQRKGGKK